MKRIPLSNSSQFAIIDDKDFAKVSERRWYLHGAGVRSGRPHIWLHHFINGNPPMGLETDHGDGNGLNNRRSNLRNATHRQNMMNSKRPVTNTSGFKGIYRRLGWKKWNARISINGKYRYLGRFGSPIEAARAYDVAAKRLYGIFARVNFPMRFPRLK